MMGCCYGYLRINAGQQFRGWGPDLFSALPLEVQMRIVQAMGPDIAQTLESMERVSHEWYNIAGKLWQLFAEEKFKDEDIAKAKQKLISLKRDAGNWKDIYTLLAPFNVRISFLADVPYDVSAVSYVRVILPGGRTLVTQGQFVVGKRLGFYDAVTGQLVPTIPLRFIDFPFEFQVGLVSKWGPDQYVAGPTTIRILNPYVINPRTGGKRRMTAIQITHTPGNITRLIAKKAAT